MKTITSEMFVVIILKEVLAMVKNISRDDSCVCCGEYVPEGRQVCRSCEEGRTNVMKKQGCFGILFDFIMTILTGGFWLIWVLIRYLRTH